MIGVRLPDRAAFWANFSADPGFRADSSHGPDAFMEDQPVEVVGDVGQVSFASARARPMVRMNRPNLFF